MIIATLSSFSPESWAQKVPALEENIPFLVTFGREAELTWGDDDYCQVFFFAVPSSQTEPIFLRIFDPEISGKHDEVKEKFDTQTKFSILGGTGCISANGARNPQPIGNFLSGNILAEKTFGSTTTYDDKWYTFGPFNAAQGELSPEHGGYIFKVVAQGISGNDGNLYQYSMSTSWDKHLAVPGGNAFTYEYTFRLHSDKTQVSHLYPFVDNSVLAVRQANFDLDTDSYIKIVSLLRKGEMAASSGDGTWQRSEHQIFNGERNSSLDIQFHQSSTAASDFNNVVFYLTNQYGEHLPFYTVPIGGVPKPKPSMITVQPAK